MEIPIYQVDAFTDQVFGGNPAAICPLDVWPDDDTLQAIAVENNLSETAFFMATDEGYDLRWFTPGAEVDLCGHATLATAHVIFGRLNPALTEVRFKTLSGELTVKRAAGGLLEMDFPSRPPGPAEPPTALAAALGGAPAEILKSRDWLVVYETAAEVAALAPGYLSLGEVLAATTPGGGAIVTAPGDSADDGSGDFDFVSRFFAPHLGIPEDPVTGSAYCTLIPFWAARLDKPEMLARQISPRGGTVHCQDAGDRILIRGHCADYLVGTIRIP